MQTKRMTQLALLVAAALIMFTVEMQIPNPFPVPGVKLGLANIVTIYAVYHYRPGEVLLVLLSRIFLGAFFSGNTMSVMYSLAGGLLCLSGALVLRRVLTEHSIWFVSVVGAVLHNTSQIAVAIMVTGTLGMLAYYPFLLISGCLAGLLTGICAQTVVQRLHKAAAC